MHSWLTLAIYSSKWLLIFNDNHFFAFICYQVFLSYTNNLDIIIGGGVFVVLWLKWWTATLKQASSNLSCYNVYVRTNTLGYQVGWGCKIHRLHLCWEVSPTPTQTSVLDMILNNLMVRFHIRTLGNAEHPFITIVSWSTLPQSGDTW